MPARLGKINSTVKMRRSFSQSEFTSRFMSVHLSPSSSNNNSWALSRWLIPLERFYPYEFQYQEMESTAIKYGDPRSFPRH